MLDEYGSCYILMQTSPVILDKENPPAKEEIIRIKALAKLTEEEKIVLGLISEQEKKL